MFIALLIAEIAKAAATALSDEKLRKTIGWVIAAILSPVILIVVLICSLLSGTANHNNTAVELTFNGGVISGQVPEEYRAYITEMRDCFTSLDSAISEVESMMEDGGSLDEIRVKAIFYALNFGRQAAAGNLRHEAQGVVDCFVTYEERTRTVTGTDENGEEYEYEETYIVAVPIADLPAIYANVAAEIGRAITSDDQANVTEIYLRVKYNNFDVGADMSLDGGNGTHKLIGELADPNAPPAEGALGSPFSDGWRSKVTSEFGYRSNPFGGGGGEGHTGLDMGATKGMPIHAVQSGKVLFVRYKTTGYGYHLAIDNGGGLVTLYGHCSEILVTEGQTVNVGEVIAKVGSTGRSTGNHLHLEFIQSGVPQNPRNYLN
ncbi:MAG: M23 family metallopeptidase [Raoultibacter sp.]